MSAMPQPIGPPPPPSRPARRMPHTRHQWYLEFLETCRAIAGLPVVVALLLEAYDLKSPLKAWITVIAVLVALTLRFFPRLRHMVQPHKGYALWMAFPWLLTAGLVFFLVFKELPRRTKLLTESWMQWQLEFEQASAKCGTSDALKIEKLKDDLSKTKDQTVRAQELEEKEKTEEHLGKCLAADLAPVLSEQRPTAGVASELMAGQMMLANGNTKSVLSDRMSIDERFLGSGFSEPRPEGAMWARVPEYLVPNLNDQSSNVWVWKLDHGMVQNQKPIAEWNLMDVLNAFEPLNHADFKARLPKTDQSHLLIRFALFDPQKTSYSGCLGRHDATRVFMSSFSELVPKTVADASHSTGYFQPEKVDEPGQVLFIWVYAPTEGDQAVRATWGNVLANFGKWITDEPCRRAT